MMLKSMILPLFFLFSVAKSQEGLARQNPDMLWHKCTWKMPEGDTCGWGVDGCFFPNENWDIQNQEKYKHGF